MLPMLRCLVLLAVAALACADVPLLAWSSHSGVFPTAGSMRFGVPVAADAALSAHLAPVLEKTEGAIVLFLQPSLSVSELAKFSGSFGKPSAMAALKAQVSSAASSLYIPSLSGDSLAQLLAAHIKTAGGAVAEVSSSEEVVDVLAASQAALNLIVVRLPQPTSDEEVAANDAVMQKALDAAAAAASHVTGLFTSLTSPASLHSADLIVPASAASAPVARRSLGSSAARRDAPASTSTSLSASTRNAEDIRYVSYRRSQRADRNYVYFTIPILMALLVGVLIVIFVGVGSGGLTMINTPERWADQSDKNLIVPAN